MKSSLLFFVCLSLASGLAAAENSCCEPTPCCEPKPVPQKTCCTVPDCITLKSYLLASGGYRFDKVKNKIGILFPNNFEMVDDELIARHLNIAETGGRGLFAFDQHWYIKGFYSYGWIFSGDYSEEFLNGSVRGNTQDGLGGIGYLNQINPYCALGILGGWGFDEQVIKLRDANLPAFDGLKFQSIWNGPWLGLDFYAHWCWDMLFNLGYELHFTEWRGSWLLKHDLPLGYTDQRRGSLSFGHVLYADVNWYWSNCWLNFEVKYQNWSSGSSGSLNASDSVPFSSSPFNGPLSAVTFLKDASWWSIGATASLGVDF